jgi:hypothetical protein
MNLIILLCIPLVPAIIVTICAVVDNKKRNKRTDPKTA